MSHWATRIVKHWCVFVTLTFFGVAQAAFAPSVNLSSNNPNNDGINHDGAYFFMNNIGDVAWSGRVGSGTAGSLELFTYNASTNLTTQITNTPNTDEYVAGLNAKGDILWLERDPVTQIFLNLQLRNGTTLVTTQLDFNFPYEHKLRMNESGDVIWMENDAAPVDAGNRDVYFYNSASGTRTNLSQSNFRDESPEFVNGRDVIWNHATGSTATFPLPPIEVKVYSATSLTTRTLPSDVVHDVGLYGSTINTRGDMVWKESSGTPLTYTVKRYDAASNTVATLATSASIISNPMIDPSGNIIYSIQSATANQVDLKYYKSSTGTTNTIALAFVDNSRFLTNGDVEYAAVGSGGYADLFIYKITSEQIVNISNDAIDNYFAGSNSNGDVIWTTVSSGTPADIFVYHAATGTVDRLTDGSSANFSPRISDAGSVAWIKYDNVGLDNDIYYATWLVTDAVWVEDTVPMGGFAVGDTDGWNWIASNPTPFSGSLAHQSANLPGQLHQHFFYNATSTLNINAGDSLFTYVYLNPASPPTEVMLQWWDGSSWEHRVYWGANAIPWGIDGTNSRRYMGPLPATGQWVRLEVPASFVGLEGVTISGMAYTLQDGQATWDRSGKSTPATPPPTITLSANPVSVASGGSSTLTWSSTDATGCTASASPNAGDWTGAKVTGGNQTVNLTVTTIYSLSCTGAGGSASQSTTITVQATNTGLKNPASQAAITSSAGDNNGFGTNPTNAFTNDGVFAVDTDSGNGTSTSCTSSNKDKHRFYDYGFVIPSGATINGIEVRLDAKVDSISNSPAMCVQLSWDGGTTWTSAKTAPLTTTAEATYMLGSATDTWGRTWSASNLSNSNFRLRVINIASSTSRDFSLDWAAVQVHYSDSGVPLPTVSISSNPTSVVSGGSSTLTWSSTNATSCTASGANPGGQWTGTKATSGNSTLINLTTTGTYTLTCTGTGGSASQSTTVTVQGGSTNTGLRDPTAQAATTSSAGDNNGFGTNPTNAFANDGVFAVDTDSGSSSSTSCTSSSRDKHRFYDYGFVIPSGSTIKGIEVRLDAKVDSTSSSPAMCVQLSWDGGSSWTSTKTASLTTTSEATYTLGSATDTWGRTWSDSNLSNANFRLRIINVADSTSRDFSLDWVAVQVHY